MPRRKHDVFIAHAWEDKDAIAGPLAEELRRRGLEVWYDDFSLKVGDHLRESIDRGLASSRFGVVILSPHFFAKEWPQYELDGLVSEERGRKQKMILPVWHEVTQADVRKFSPTLALTVAARSADGLTRVADQISLAIPPRRSRRSQRGTVKDLDAIVSEVSRSGIPVTAPDLKELTRLMRHPAPRPWLDPIGRPEGPLPIRAEQVSQTGTPTDRKERGQARIVDLRVSSLGQYDATVEWGTTATMEVLLSAFRAADGVPVRPSIPVQSIGLPGRTQTLTFHDLEPSTAYRIVAESTDDRQEVTVETHGLEPKQ